MDEALKKYLEAIKADYAKWNSLRPTAEDDIQAAVRQRMTDEFNNGLTVENGRAYLKVITSQGSSRSVHSFIVKEDGPKFKKGDILKAAGWNAPAKNSARGNIFGEYTIHWTGAEYLR